MTEVLGKRNKSASLGDKVVKKVKGKKNQDAPADSNTFDEVNEELIPTKTKKVNKKKVRDPSTEPEEFDNNDDINNAEEEGVVEVEEEEEEEKTNASQGKKVHLTLDQIEARIKELQEKVDELSGPENAKKRKRVYARLIQLKKAAANPDLAVDPVEEQQRVQEDKQRRIQKKIDKAKRQRKENSKSQKKKNYYCIICKNRGHVAENCLENKKDTTMVQELQKHICFNCGSSEHSLHTCPKPRGQTLEFATCFFCKERGHLSRDCPKNEEGIYHKGGSCFQCGSKRHLAKECPYRGQNRTNEEGFSGFNKNERNQNNQNGGEDDHYEDQANENDIFSEGEDN